MRFSCPFFLDEKEKDITFANRRVFLGEHIGIKSVLCVERKPINSIVNMEKLFERHDAYLQGVQHKEALAKKMTI